MAWNKQIPTNDELLINFPALCRANWEAIELGTDSDLLITNAKIAAAAGIVDTKLAQITTAGKVHGSSLTGLASIPAGAGGIPNVNLAQITVSEKVHGSSLTGLASIPAGAGGIPEANLDGAAVVKTGNQTIAGIKTFSSIPVLPASNPTSDNEAARKKYVDDIAMKYSDTRFKVGTFTKDITDASGTQVITGVGFAPKAVIFLGVVGSDNNATWGIDDLTDHRVLLDFADSSPGTYSANVSNSIYVYQGASVAYEGYISATSSDGFTITWTKTGSPTGTLTVYYLALR